MANIARCLMPKSKLLMQRQNHARNFMRTAIKLEAEPANTKLNAGSHKVNNLEKRFLVWTGKFKSIEEVPTLVPSEVMEKARNRIRIRLANIMMAVTLVACLLVSMSGKRAHERGESVQKENLEWHRKIKEEAGKEKQN